MVGIVIASHGKFAEGIFQSGSMIFGDQADVKPVTLLPSEGPEDIRKKMEEAIATFSQQDEILFLIDLWSGTPFNQASALIDGHEGHWVVVTGLNLPMLIESYALRLGTESAADIASHVAKTSREGIRIFKEDIIEFLGKQESILLPASSYNSHIFLRESLADDLGYDL